jgi:SSS family transporter
MNWLLVGIVAYIAVQIGIGVAVSRRMASEVDYLLAGRRFGYGLATFSIFATWFGAETCVGSAGQVYEEGLSRLTTEPYAYGLTLVLSGLVFATPLWRRKLTTLADLFRVRFSPGVERAASILLIPTSVCWAAAQIRAFGHVLTTASTIEIDLAIAVAAAVAVVYTASGGLLADALTDIIQGIALTIGLVVLLAVVVGAVGGVGAAFDAVRTRAAASPPEVGPLATLEAWSLPVLGSVVAQELVARISASRSAAVARRASVIAGVGYLAVGSIPVTIALLAPSLLPEHAGDAEQVLPILAQRHLSTFAYLLFAGALVSAILSTVDSTLLVASSLFSHNLVLRSWPQASERAKVRLARAGVVGFGVVAYLLAIGSDSVSTLIEQTNGFGSAGVFVIVVFGLFTSIGGAASAFAALGAGVVVYFAGLWTDYEYAYLASLVAALCLYLAGAGISRNLSVPSPEMAGGSPPTRSRQKAASPSSATTARR